MMMMIAVVHVIENLATNIDNNHCTPNDSNKHKATNTNIHAGPDETSQDATIEGNNFVFQTSINNKNLKKFVFRINIVLYFRSFLVTTNFSKCQNVLRSVMFRSIPFSFI